jgi:hypothetical protein
LHDCLNCSILTSLLLFLAFTWDYDVLTNWQSAWKQARQRNVQTVGSVQTRWMLEMSGFVVVIVLSLRLQTLMPGLASARRVLHWALNWNHEVSCSLSVDSKYVILFWLLILPVWLNWGAALELEWKWVELRWWRWIHMPSMHYCPGTFSEVAISC